MLNARAAPQSNEKNCEPPGTVAIAAGPACSEPTWPRTLAAVPVVRPGFTTKSPLLLKCDWPPSPPLKPAFVTRTVHVLGPALVVNVSVVSSSSRRPSSLTHANQTVFDAVPSVTSHEKSTSPRPFSSGLLLPPLMPAKRHGPLTDGASTDTTSPSRAIICRLPALPTHIDESVLVVAPSRVSMKATSPATWQVRLGELVVPNV